MGRYYAVATKFEGGETQVLHRLGIGPSRYVALGDSFSAGEGVPEFELGTAADVTPVPDGLEERYPNDNKCHRSERGSYSQRLAADESIDVNLLPATFAACSGAVTRDVDRNNPKNSGEKPQVEHLSEFTDLVTMTMGGNDVGFGDIAMLCTLGDCSHESFNDLVSMWEEGTFVYRKLNSAISAAGCATFFNLTIPGKIYCVYKGYSALNEFKDPSLLDTNRWTSSVHLDNGVLRQRLVRIYTAIADAAPNAHVLVLRYPHISDLSAPNTSCELYPGLYFSLSSEERAVVASVVDRINAQVDSAVAQVNSAEGTQQFDVVDSSSQFAGHELCRSGELNPESYFNSVVPPDGSVLGKVPYSFHPNADGQKAFARAARTTLQNGVAANVINLQPLESRNAGSVFVPFGARRLHAEAAWNGSTVDLSVTSPGGATYDKTSPGVRFGQTPTSIWLEIDDPEPGTWTVNVFGAELPAGGEPVQVTSYASSPPPTPPEVDLEGTPVQGQPDTFDLHAAGPGGATYLWTFPNGEQRTGPYVRYSFPPNKRRTAMVFAESTEGGRGWFPLDLGPPDVDDVPPDMLGAQDLHVEGTSVLGAVVDYVKPTARDDGDGAVEVNCSPAPGSEFPYGTTRVECTATDSAGNERSEAFNLTVEDLEAPDTTAPNTDLTGGPEGPTADRSPTFTYGSPAADLAGFKCRLTREEFADCLSAGRTFNELADGPYTFEVKAVDSSGNADPTAASRSFTVDATPPDTSILTGPEGPISTNAASFTYAGSPVSDLAGFQCRLDAAPFAACPATGRSFAGLSDGQHRFEVRAVDALGNADVTVAFRTFTVDTRVPVDPGGPGPIEPLRRSLRVSQSGTGTGLVTSSPDGIDCGLTCEFAFLDGTPVTLTATPQPGSVFMGWSGQCSGLEPCQFSLVGSVDVAAEFRKLAPAPETKLKKATIKPLMRRATFVFSSTGGDGTVAFACRLDKAAFSVCESPKTYKRLKPGKHTFSVVAVDSAFQVDAVFPSKSFRIPPLAPVSAP